MKVLLQNSYTIKVQTQIKIMFTKMSSELKHTIEDIRATLGAVAVAVKRGEDPPVVRHIVYQVVKDGGVLKEKTKRKKAYMSKNAVRMSAREKTQHTEKKRISANGRHACL